MSFGFSLGDFVAVSQLAWTLYRDCYKIARGAPQEFQLLVGEISTLSNSLTLLQEEAKDPESPLVLAGEDRVRMVNEMVQSISVTLKSLEKVAKKYEILGSSSKKRQIWGKFKWSLEFTSIDGLRNKLVYHNTVMNLLLTSVGNSSLQRIESSTDALEKDVREIKAYITGQKSTEQPLIPSISAVDGDSQRTTLSALLLRNAEVLQPWSTIGVDQWIECGRWWLLRAQMELYTVMKPGQEIPLAPYTSLIKASWILVDIIACHPQVPFLSPNSRAEVQVLSTELKTEFQRLQRLDSVIPDLSDLEGEDLRIWESQTKGPLLRPSKGEAGPAEVGNQWRVEGGEEVLFQRFAVCKYKALLEPIPCIALLLVRQETESVRLLATNQNGSVVMAITSDREMKLQEIKGSEVLINEEEITFSSRQDAELLCSLIEGTNFYYFGRGTSDWSVDELKAFMLLHAIKSRRREIATLLLEKLPRTGDLDGDSADKAVAIARDLANDQARGLLKDDLAPETKASRHEVSLFQWAIECNFLALVILLIAKKAKVEGSIWRGENPLTLASRCGHIALIPHLIPIADINKRASNGWHAINEAAYQGHARVIRLLLRNGAEIEATTQNSLSSLSIAARRGHDSCVQLLIDKGANIEHISRDRLNPLMEACETSKDSCITLLLDEGANTCQALVDGRTTYHIALEASISAATFALLSSKFFAQNHRDRAPAFPATTGTVTFYMDTDWSSLYLDSPHAYFEHPEGLPKHIKDTHGHRLEIGRPDGVKRQFFKYTYTCNIVYRTPELYFSTGHGSTATDNRKGRTTLTVQGSGPTGLEAKLETSPTGHSTNFRRHAAMRVDSRQ